MNRPDFNPVARLYRWMEYFSFGRSLERCRFAQLDHAGHPQHALVLGDGDGRFLARLLQSYPELTADVIDASPAMIQLAKQRTRNTGSRARFHIADLRTYTIPEGTTYDLVCAHFFLDCLSDTEVSNLFNRIGPHIAPNALCFVSEFAIPSREPLRSLAQVLIGSLYLAFRVLAGLEIRELPHYASALSNCGFVNEATTLSLGGILRSERWRFQDGLTNRP